MHTLRHCAGINSTNAVARQFLPLFPSSNDLSLLISAVNSVYSCRFAALHVHQCGAGVTVLQARRKSHAVRARFRLLNTHSIVELSSACPGACANFGTREHAPSRPLARGAAYWFRPMGRL